jgi:hypothetical protein
VPLNNLLGNAWKYTSKTPGARIDFGATRTEKGKAFFIKDNGACFDIAQANKLAFVEARCEDSRFR